MSDTSKRIELGAHAFFQLGAQTVIPNDGNAELATAVQKINGSIARLEDRGVTKA